MAYCKEPDCGKEIIFLFNRETGKTVPVDLDSMKEEEIYRHKNRTAKVYYNKSYHISHFKTCSKPFDFSKSKRK